MTRKLYDEDSHLARFSAAVLSCEEAGEGWALTLDQTAFFPEGGGQAADTGHIGPVRVLDVQEKEGRILHLTDGPLAPGTYDCALDWEQRFGRMQGHSGEHVLSGLVHSRFGFDNVGFHMAPEGITVDFNGELTAEELRELELAANRAVWENRSVTAEYPPPEILAAMEYRSKLALTENVRIVTIEGVDRCACCAPHVSRTGEIGAIKILDFMRHRGGTRLTMLAGAAALEDYRAKQDQAAAISALLSARRDALVPAVTRVWEELQAARYELNGLRRELLLKELEARGETAGNLCFFVPAGFDGQSLRTLVNAAMERCGGMAAVFCGDDAAGYQYVIGSKSIDLRAGAKELNAAIQGRGGGQKEMIQGSAKAPRSVIEARFA